MDAARRDRVEINGLSNRAKHLRRHRVRRVGRQAHPHAIGIGQAHSTLPARLLDESDRIRRIETNQLVEDDGRERAAR